MKEFEDFVAAPITLLPHIIKYSSQLCNYISEIRKKTLLYGTSWLVKKGEFYPQKAVFHFMSISAEIFQD